MTIIEIDDRLSDCTISEDGMVSMEFRDEEYNDAVITVRFWIDSREEKDILKRLQL